MINSSDMRVGGIFVVHNGMTYTYWIMHEKRQIKLYFWYRQLEVRKVF